MISMLAVGVLVVCLSACAATRSAAPVKIALLAPFEGRYREIGYNALYSVRLALADQGDRAIELLAVDDGGAVESAVSRGRALALDPSVLAVVALGYQSADAAVQRTLDGVPMLIVGNWSTRPMRAGVFILSNAALNTLITAPPHVDVTEAARLDSPVRGGEVFGLEQFARLRESLDGISVVSSGSVPGTDFDARYRGGDPFAPEPGLLALSSYDGARLIAQLIAGGLHDRAALIDAVMNARYSGLSGRIRFTEGYWADAPIHRFRFDEIGKLRAVNDVVK